MPQESHVIYGWTKSHHAKSWGRIRVSGAWRAEPGASPQLAASSSTSRLFPTQLANIPLIYIHIFVGLTSGAFLCIFSQAFLHVVGGWQKAGHVLCDMCVCSDGIRGLSWQWQPLWLAVSLFTFFFFFFNILSADVLSCGSSSWLQWGHLVSLMHLVSEVGAAEVSIG